MATVKNFGLAGVSDDVQFGKSGGRFTFASSEFSVRDSTDSTFAQLNVPTTPTSDQHATSKVYVDSVATGLDFKDSVHFATTANLPSTYDNGTAGFGATLTATVAGVLPPSLTDSHAHFVIGTRILVKDQTDQRQNGLYTITTLGAGEEVTEVTTVNGLSGAEYFTFNDGSTDFYVWYDLDGGSVDPAPGGTGIEVDISTGHTVADVTSASIAAINGSAALTTAFLDEDEIFFLVNDSTGVATDATAATSGFTISVTIDGTVSPVAWVLTRSVDADNSPGSEVSGGMFVFVEDGATLAGTGWVLSEPAGVVVIGTDDQVFSQFSGAGTFTGGSGIDITGTTISADVAAGSVIADTAGTGTQLGITAGTSGQPLLSGGGSEAAFGALDLASATSVTGILDETNGGTGTGTVTVGDLLRGAGTNTWDKLSIGADNTVLKSDGSTFSWETQDAADVTVTPAGGLTSTTVQDALEELDSQLTGLDATRITDGANVTVDTDLVNGTVTIDIDDANDAGAHRIAEFQPVSTDTTATDARFEFTARDSVDTGGNDEIIVTADGGATDIDIRLTPKGAGEVLIGTTGQPGVIQADDEQSLTVKGGDGTVSGDAGDMIIEGGDGTGTLANGDVLIRPGTGGTGVAQVCIQDGDSENVACFLGTAGTDVNYFQFTSAATASGITLESVGTDLNIDLTVTAKGTGRVTIDGNELPDGATAVRSVWAFQNSVGAGDVQEVTATAGADRVLRYNDSTGDIEWTLQSAVGGNIFSTFATDGASIVADSTSDTATFTGGEGVTTAGDASSDTITIAVSMTEFGTETTITTAELITYVDAGTLNKKITTQNFMNSLDIVHALGGNGIAVQTGTDTYTARTITASVAAGEEGVTITNGDGVAGNPTVGIDLSATTFPTPVTDLADTDRFFIRDASGGVNAVTTWADIKAEFVAETNDNAISQGNSSVTVTDVGTGDVTTVVDGGTVITTTASAMDVDVQIQATDGTEAAPAYTFDSVSDSGMFLDGNSDVCISDEGLTVACFQGVASAVNYFTFVNSATGTTLDMQATGDDTNIDITLTPKGTGEVILGSSGNATLSTDAGDDLTIQTGDNGAGASGDVFIQPGTASTTAGEVCIRDESEVNVMCFDGVASAVNSLQVVNAATGSGPEFQAEGSDSNIDIEFLPKGTGVLHIDDSIADATYAANVTDGNDIPNKQFVDDAVASGTVSGTTSAFFTTVDDVGTLGTTISIPLNADITRVVVNVTSVYAGSTGFDIGTVAGSTRVTDDSADGFVDWQTVGTYIIDHFESVSLAASNLLLTQSTFTSGTGAATLRVEYVND